MALGPKAMGEAIVANLKAKSGKDLAEWQAEIERNGLTNHAEARQYLREQGLGQFQAISVIQYTFGTDLYADAERLVGDQFVRYPEQRLLYDLAVSRLEGETFTAKPCRSYLPIYRDGRIAISFKPTGRGLYAALNLVEPARWSDRVDHKPSLGGSARLKDGLYLAETSQLDLVLEELR